MTDTYSTAYERGRADARAGRTRLDNPFAPFGSYLPDGTVRAAPRVPLRTSRLIRMWRLGWERESKVPTA